MRLVKTFVPLPLPRGPKLPHRRQRGTGAPSGKGVSHTIQQIHLHEHLLCHGPRRRGRASHNHRPQYVIQQRQKFRRGVEQVEQIGSVRLLQLRALFVAATVRGTRKRQGGKDGYGGLEQQGDEKEIVGFLLVQGLCHERDWVHVDLVKHVAQARLGRAIRDCGLESKAVDEKQLSE